MRSPTEGHLQAFVQELPSSLWTLRIEEVSPNSDSVRLTWPIFCGSSGLEATPGLNPPAVWTPITVPVQLHDGRNARPRW